MQEIKYNYINRWKYLEFVFEWEFTNNNVLFIFAEIDEVIGQEKLYNVVFNMQNIDTINSRFAWAISSIFEECDSRWWIVIVYNCNTYVDDALDLLWMYFFIKKASNKEEINKLIS